MQDTLIQIRPREQQHARIKITQNAIQGRVEEAAHAELGHMKIALFGCQFVDDLRTPRSRFKHPG